MTTVQLDKIIIERFLSSILSIINICIISLPAALVVGGLSAYILKKYKKKNKIVELVNQQRAIIFLSAYITILLEVSILFRPIGEIHQIDLIPFDMPGGTRYIVLYSIANVLVFIPLGFLVPMIWTKLCKTGDIIVIGFLSSLLIEISQLVLQCGVFQTEDMIMNTIGAAIGYRIYKIVIRQRKR